MPVYEYKCGECEHKFELSHGYSKDTGDIKCPKCGGPVKRMITGGSGFIMKGGGTRNMTGNRQKPACGKETTCCGKEYSCGKSEECR